MNDQTRGEAPGEGPAVDVPLKRDRKRLRSSDPWPPAAVGPEESAPRAESGEPDLREHALSPAEQLFAGQWTASVPTPAMPASFIPPEPSAFAGAADRPDRYDVDLTESDEFDATETAVPAKPRFGLGLLKRSKPDSVENDQDEFGQVESGQEPVGVGSVGSSGAEPAVRPEIRRPHSSPAPTGLYIPPGGFTGPGHPRLGPVVPAPLQKHSGLASLDIAALVAAFIVPPVGLIAAIVALIRGRRIRGWASDLARAAVSVSLIMSIVFAGVGGYLWIQETERMEQLAAVKAEQRAHDRVAATSAQFCETLAANPTIYSTADPDYGWPGLDAPGGYPEAIANYAAVWAQIAAVAPAGISEETAAISERVNGIVNIANALGSQNRAGDLLGLHAATDLATVESWYVQYCNAPELAEPETPVE